MPLPLEQGGAWEQFGKFLRGFAPAGEALPTREQRIEFDVLHQRLNYYGCLKPEAPTTHANLNFASIPHPSEIVRAHVASFRDRLRARTLGREQREALWQEAREKACRLIGHPDPRGVLLAGNTTQALAFFHFLSGMLHGKNRVGLHHNVLTTDVENSATYRTIATIGEDGNPFGRDALTTYPNMHVSPVRETERKFSLASYWRLETRGKTLEDMTIQLRAMIRPSLMLGKVPDTLVLSHVDRETGRELPVKELIAYARELKKKADPKHPHLYCVVDGAQALGNLPRVDWNDLGADMYVMSPHKTMGSERLGIAFFNPDHPLVQDGLKLLRCPDLQVHVPIYDGNFHPDLGIEASGYCDEFYGQVTGIPRLEINPLEVAAFSKAVDELEEAGYLHGNDFSALDRHRCEVREYCRLALEGLRGRSKIDVVVPPIDRPTNFILPFRIGPEQKPVRRLPWLTSLLPDRWRPPEPEGFGHEIGRRLSERGTALTYFSEPNLFRASFDRETTREGIDRFIGDLEVILPEIPELKPGRAS
jgi:selenocysteine lyase/cysteine desulfurase